MYQTRSDFVHAGKNFDELFSSTNYVTKAENATGAEIRNPMKLYTACEDLSRQVLTQVLLKIDEGASITDLMTNVDETLLNQLSD